MKNIIGRKDIDKDSYIILYKDDNETVIRVARMYNNGRPNTTTSIDFTDGYLIGIVEVENEWVYFRSDLSDNDPDIDKEADERLALDVINDLRDEINEALGVADYE